MGRIVTFTGPSASGKTTILRELIKKHGFGFFPGITTRPVRQSEGGFTEMVHVPPDEFERLYLSGELLWDEHAFGNRYGMRRDLIDDAYAAPEGIHIANITPRTTRILYDHLSGDLDCLFFKTPSLEVARQRMLDRGNTESQIAGRLQDYGRWEREATESGLPYKFVDATRNGGIDENVKQVLGYLRE